MRNEPRISIILINYNSYRDTLNCINSLIKTNYKNYQIIVVDNNSTDDSHHHLSELDSIKLIENSVNQGFAGGNNAGIRYALQNGSDYVLLLNNDTLVQYDFLSRLIHHISNLNDFGMASCKILYEDRKVWFGGAHFNRTFGKLRIYTDNTLDQITPVNFLTGCMLLIKREVIETIGLLDERYFMYFEDLQFCHRALKAGFTLYYIPYVEIVHLIGDRSSYYVSKYFTMRNRKIFIKEELGNAFLPNLYFYAANYLKVFYLWLKGDRLHKYILKGIADYKLGKTGNTFDENLS